MKNVILALITSLLMVASSQVFAHSNDAAGANESGMTATSASKASGHEYVVAKNGADDGAGDVGDDHGGR
jgi:methionine-rich copper-binding protein CopC